MLQQYIDATTYSKFSSYIEEKCGIVLGNDKEYLVISRLTPLLAKFNFSSIQELINQLILSPNSLLGTDVIDAITTNETLWFRDKYPFDILKNRLLPDFLGQPKPLKIWSAASSSGQEPYSIAMSVYDFIKANPNAFPAGIQIIGTDISKTMINKCEYAHYDKLALARGLSLEQQKRFFKKGENGMLTLKSEIKNMVKFCQLNLLEQQSFIEKFDIIFCRNLLIYFEINRKIKIISQIYERLNNKGFLILGASESLTGINDNFQTIRCDPGIIFQKTTL